MVAIVTLTCILLLAQYSLFICCGVLCECFEYSQNLVLFCDPSNVLILLFHSVLLSVLLNFVLVILYRENFRIV